MSRCFNGTLVVRFCGRLCFARNSAENSRLRWGLGSAFSRSVLHYRLVAGGKLRVRRSTRDESRRNSAKTPSLQTCCRHRRVRPEPGALLVENAQQVGYEENQ